MTKIKDYDLIVIGSGAGLNVASDAYSEGMKVALFDDGPIGGTCLNRGCIPTKIILYPAEIIASAEHAKRIGVDFRPPHVDFPLIMKRMRSLIDEDVSGMMKGIKSAKGLDFYNAPAGFVGKKLIGSEGKRFTAPLILIAAGSRETIPGIEGLKEAGYLTSTTALELKKTPKSLVIIGGGYIATEFGHFFSAMGTNVTILGRNRHLVPQEEPEISEELKSRLSERMEVHTGMEVVKAGKKLFGKYLLARNRETGEEQTFTAEEIMVAVGRGSNSDMFHPEASGIEVDEKGWVKVDRYLRTNVKGIYAIGDAIGRNMFRHTANYEAGVAWNNMTARNEEELEELDERSVPHAVFTYPEIASVGMREEEAVKEHLVLVGTAKYTDAIKGYAMDEPTSFVKVIIEAKTNVILGAHAIGPHATAMVQPIVYLMNAGKGTYMPLVRAQTIHPAMEEIMVRAFGNLRPGKGQESRFGHSHSDHEGHSHSH